MKPYKLAWVPIDLQTLELCVGNDDDSNNYISHENYTKNFVLLKVPSLLLFAREMPSHSNMVKS